MMAITEGHMCHAGDCDERNCMRNVFRLPVAAVPEWHHLSALHTNVPSCHTNALVALKAMQMHSGEQMRSDAAG